MSEDFIEGWKAARAYWSANHGSLPPYPPQAPQETPPAPAQPSPEPLGMVEPDEEE